MSTDLDAVVVGSGPNGLAAAIRLAQQGLRVHVIEGHDELGGGMRTAELTEPGFLHDVCSTAHPFAKASPFLSQLSLEDHGLDWVQIPVAVAHPMDNDDSANLEGSVDTTAAMLGTDGDAYRKLLAPLVEHQSAIFDDTLAPLLGIPRHPIAMARFGRHAITSIQHLMRRFETDRARALLAGIGAHSIMPLDRPATSGVGLSLAMAGHTVGWPIAAGGSASIVRALASKLASLGGTTETGRWVRNLDELPPARSVLLDITPSQFATMASTQLPKSAVDQSRTWGFGPAVFKLDLALNAPIPWSDGSVRRAGTVHLGGRFEEIAAAERQAWSGAMSDRPYVLVNQPTLFDPSRAPAGKHTAWAYCHVPAGWPGDATDLILGQIERFAPGIRDTIIAKASMGPADYQRYNPNNVDGSIGGGALTLRQIVARPRWSLRPYATPIDDVYLCSASTPPGAGTHGMCGYWAATAALKASFGITAS